MNIPGSLLPHKVEQGFISSFLPRPQQLQEEICPGRIGKVQKKNLSRPPLLHKKGAPAGIGRDGLAKAPAGQLSRPFSGLLLPEVHLSGLSGHSTGRSKAPKDSLPRSYRDPKSLLPRPCKSRSSIPVGERLREFTKEWMGITQAPFVLGTIQEHLLHFNQNPPW